MRKFSNEITIGSILVIILGLLIFWFIRPETVALLKIEVAILICLIAGGALIIKFAKRRNDKLSNSPAEDEFSKHVKLVAGNHAFHFSMAVWFVIFIFKDTFTKNEEMLGIGILSSAAIYGILILYYKSTGDFLNEE